MEDLTDHIKQTIRKELDIAVIIHAGTNDLQNHCNILKKAQKLVCAIKKMNKDLSTKIAFSSIINREDKDFKDKINISIIHLKAIVTQQLWILLAIQILMDHVWIELSCTWIEKTQQL